MNTKEVAEYLDINEKQVYVLIKENKIPCTKITGKWIFPKQLIDEWINNHAMEQIKYIKNRVKQSTEGILAAGSNDPVLDILLNQIKQRDPMFYIFSTSTGSITGLHLLNNSLVDVAWSHLYDSETDSYNIPYVKRFCKNKDVVVIHLFDREIGLVCTPHIKNIVKDFPSITHSDIVFVNRQEGSGIRQLTELYLSKHSINPANIKGYSNIKYSHIEIGLAIQSGEANCGIASVAIANYFKLQFIPLTIESFDMVVSKEIYFNKVVQTLINELHNQPFINKIKTIGNYNFNGSGDIKYVSSEDKL